MATRLVEAVLPAGRAPEIDTLLGDQTVLSQTTLPLTDGRLIVRVVIDADHTQALFDELNARFGSSEDFSAVLLNVEATLPRPSSPDALGSEPDTRDEPSTKRIGQNRISREELYHRISELTEVNAAFTITVCLSTIVAAVGLIRGDIAVLIGAMVIAPLLGPNVALALATTLADELLMRRAMLTNIYGIALAFSVAVATGWILEVDLTTEMIASRTEVGVGDVVLALAAGSACALAYTSAVPAALIGVMVAVALLPPLVVVGLLMASAELALAGGASLLVATNVICVNLAGTVTFLWQGVRPRTWWEADRARRATRRAIAIWLTLLVALGILATLAGG